MDNFMVFITYFGEYGLFWIIIAIAFLCYKPTRKYGIVLAIALIVDIVSLNGIIKPLVQRIRPCYINHINLIVEAPTGYSFPSGHTGACFSAAFALFFSKNKYWVPAMILAVLVGFSRNYLYVHFPTDVLGGLVIGLLAGYIGNYIYEKNLIPQAILNMLK